jgi:glycosyltransferase involved in cell wall biosynthesis
MLAVFQSGPLNYPSRLALKTLTWARRRRQRWMAVSRHVLSNLQLVFSARADEIGILANGIEITKAPSEAVTESLRRGLRFELEVPPSAKILLTTGRLDLNKGHADLLQIAPRIIDKFPDAIFVWAGDGAERNTLEAQVGLLGLQRHVRILGYRTDIERLLRASDLFVFPSHVEGGCSSSIREAMMNYLPIVCSDAGGIPEVIFDGVHGLMFPANNIDVMFARLCSALNHVNEMRSLAKQARQRIEGFSADRMIQEYLAVFHDLCQHDRTHAKLRGPGW